MADGRDLELLRPLGQGGFGVVWLARFTGRDGFSRRVAVKVMRDAESAPAEVVARQRDEARLLGLLQHPNIVQVFDLTQVDGAPAVVMEHVEGVDVATILKLGGPLPLGVAIAIAAAAAAALDAGWNAVSPESGRPLRVIHRDIKPANVLVTIHGTVKVLDFGVARADFDREGRTQSMAFGTPRFMAPEQFLAGEVTPGNDVYALAVTLWEMTTGRTWERPPVGEEGFTPKVAELLAGAPELLVPILQEMTRFQTSRRPTAATVLTRLEALSVGADPLRAWARTTLPEMMLRQEADLAQKALRNSGSRSSGSGAGPAPTAVGPTWASGPIEPGSDVHGGASRAPEVAADPPDREAPASIGSEADSGVSLAAPSPGLGRERVALGAAAGFAGAALVVGLLVTLLGGLWWWTTGGEAPADPLVESEGAAGAADDNGEIGAAGVDAGTGGHAAPDAPPTSTPTAPVTSGDGGASSTAAPSTGTSARSGASRSGSSQVSAPETAGPVRIAPTSGASGSSATAASPPASPESDSAPAAATVPTTTPSSATESSASSAAPATAATAAPAKAIPTRTITIKASVKDTVITLDGKRLGKTPLSPIAIPYGTHSLQAEDADGVHAKTITIDGNTPSVVKYDAASGKFVWE